ncbi:hypothetical protein AS9A_0635 [Hoyosella subflava DQS3-9A1]|uniref:Uncharacterized protein n=1 Tax=Hoyosella subflava (strain DSM 45089 / JCM 17490 / NBRC 109087 / DQS3-9A1) TaxID=443218 RepID=F6EKB8_HOYSD|nr:hypothetical protein AS9A_0635 [Hoyosella subflava DQS3-9A1]
MLIRGFLGISLAQLGWPAGSTMRGNACEADDVEQNEVHPQWVQ